MSDAATTQGSGAALRDRVEEVSAAWSAAGGSPGADLVEAATVTFADFLAALEAGHVRAAQPDPNEASGWRVEAWVKTGILLGFPLARHDRLSRWTHPRGARSIAAYGVLDILDSDAARAAAAEGSPWRVVPGGTTVRSGVHLEPSVTIMPPAYANVGAWVGRGSMIDSHVLVGSCAQIGQRVHLGRGSPGRRCHGAARSSPRHRRRRRLHRGWLRPVRRRHRRPWRRHRGRRHPDRPEPPGRPRRRSRAAWHARAPLVVPPGSVVVPGTRPASTPYAREHGIALTVPIIVKQRDDGTDARVALEDALR